MENIKFIIDLGASELRIGYTGELEPSATKINIRDLTETDYIQFLYPEFKAMGSNVNVILLEKNIRNQAIRESICQVLFEKTDVSKLFILKNSVARLYGCGKSSGTVIENSETSFEMVSVEDGFLDQYPTVRSSFNFRAISGDNIAFSRSVLMDSIARGEYTLPDNIKIKLSDYEYQCTSLIDEFLNKNNVFSKDLTLGGRLFLHKGLYGSMVKFLPSKFSMIKGCDKAENLINGAFVGASIVGVVSAIDSLFVSKAELEEFGSSILNKQFP